MGDNNKTWGLLCEANDKIRNAYDILQEAARTLIKTAPHEMTAREFVRARNRMCVVYRRNDRETGCWECPLYDFCGEYNDDEDIARQNADEAVAIVEKWAEGHPEERSEE